MDKNIIELLETISTYTENRISKKLSTESILILFKLKIKANDDSTLIKLINSLKLNQYERVFYLYVIWKALNCEDQCDYVEYVNQLFDDTYIRLKFLQTFVNESNKLFSQKLIETLPNRYGLTMVTLTKKSRDTLQTIGYDLKNTRDYESDIFTIIENNNITEKTLIYNESEENEIYKLNQIFKPSNFKKIQNKLKQASFNPGITILMYGPPGTGKTETALQLAKKNSTKILLVNVSELRTKYYGESERLVKNMFKYYNEIFISSTTIPILLLNEADSIFNSRLKGNLSSTERSENTILNIILTELETFQGILIATTNLNSNLDKALDRRLLYKLEFKNPTKNTQIKLWKNSFPMLSSIDCKNLVNEFELTGAQINNIVKKTMTESIISSLQVNFQLIRQYCIQETAGLSNSHKKQVGYLNSNKNSNIKILNYENSTSAS